MFTTDSRTEMFLDWLGVRWRYSNDMTFALMSTEWDNTNLGRSQVKVDKAVKEYGALMDRGSAAPAPILWQNSDSRLEVIDGMQRLLAERDRSRARFSAYVVETDSAAMVKKIRIFANYRLQGGHQESAEWTLGQAIVVLINDGTMTCEEVADIGGWSLATVRDKKECMDWGFAIRCIGGPEKLPDSMIRVIAGCAQRSYFDSAAAPVAEFLNDIKRMRLSTEEAEPYIADFFSVARNKANLHEQFASKLDEFHSDDEVATRLADPARRRYQPMTAEGRLMRSLKAALTTAERVKDSGEKVPFVAEYMQIVNGIERALKQIEASSRRQKNEHKKTSSRVPVEAQRLLEKRHARG